MTSIDWSKAPRRATHADPHGEAFYCAELEGTRGPYVWHPEDNLWVLDMRTSLDALVPRPDPVNHPEHYTAGSVECIDAIKAQMTREEFLGYLRGNVVKYLWRYRHKGGVESLKKAQWYLDKLISEQGEQS